MLGRGLLVLTILSNCVLSLPVTSSQLENEDVKVMKCIVEALADVLSRPHTMPVSQECLVTLKTDDRLVAILRHRSFLRELQEIAVQGGQERAQLQGDAATPDPTTQAPQGADDAADRSMLDALGGPGERSILSQMRRTGNGHGEGEKDEGARDGASREDGDIAEEVQVKRDDNESAESHVSESVDEWREGKAEKREGEEGEEESEEKRANSEEENLTKEKKGAASGEKRDAPRNKSKEKKKFDDEDEEEKDKRSALFPNKQEEERGEEKEEEEEEAMKRGSRESPKRWTKRGKGLQLKRKAGGGEARQQLHSQQEVLHHSKEVAEDEGEKKKRGAQRSPEEKELQMIARRAPEERRGSEEEGSASRKSEEPEIESLAAIESELENVAQKLHELRRG